MSINNRLLYERAKHSENVINIPPDSHLSSLEALLIHLEATKQKTMLTEAASSLLTRLYLQSIHVSRRNKPKHKKELTAVHQSIQRCADTILQLLQNPDDKNALKTLQKLAARKMCEQPIAGNAAKRYFFRSIDGVINGVNALRSFIFRMPYPYSRMAAGDFISEELQVFVLKVSQPCARKDIDQLSVVLQTENIEKKELHCLPEDLRTQYDTFCAKHQQEKELLEASKKLMDAINEFARQTATVKENEVLYAAAQNALITSQDLVSDLLVEPNPCIKKMQRLKACFLKTARVIEKPGNKKEIESLRVLMERSDFQRFSCDREKTCYALIHILVAAALLAFAALETAATGGVNLLVESFTLGAEGISLLVGCGQLGYFSGSHVQKTLFNESMDTLFKAARINYYGGDISHPANDNYNDLCNSLKSFETHVDQCSDPLLQAQGSETLNRAKEFMNDLVRNPKTTSAQIKHFRDCIDAAGQLMQKPHSLEVVQDLLHLAKDANYEQRRTDKQALFVGLLLLSVSLAIYVITIAATIFSMGATAGTIISPIMLSALAINKIVDSRKRDSVLFTDEVKKLGQYSEILFADQAPANKNKNLHENWLDCEPINSY